MQRITCPTVLIHPDAVVPTRGTDVAAGHDIYCVAGVYGLESGKWDDAQIDEWLSMGNSGYVILAPHTGFLFRTGFSQAIQPGYVCLLHDRSGMGAKKQVGKLAGVIDEDYRGEWFVRLVNHSDQAVTICVGDKIVQGLYQERVEAEFPVVDTLADTARGTGGFGSTDKPKVERQA